MYNISHVCIIKKIAQCYTIFLIRCPLPITKLLQSTEKQSIERGGIQATKLYTHTAEVENTNQRELNALAGENKRFCATDNDASCVEQLNALCPVPSNLVLKIGAQVSPK